ncbi:hypothetical protein PUN28_018736 [Cardiocondyla obscurior]|uniref:Uncharacterized protein n=1 Tax=Cardiocondyla obscurior TaxID=286306 RepID=A0AAW2EFC1_9HYME
MRGKWRLPTGIMSDRQVRFSSLGCHLHRSFRLSSIAFVAGQARASERGRAQPRECARTWRKTASPLWLLRERRGSERRGVIARARETLFPHETRILARERTLEGRSEREREKAVGATRPDAAG